MDKGNLTLDQTKELFDFLQGNFCPKGYVLTHKPKLGPQKAFTVIYVLQEYFHIIPDHYEMCQSCHALFDRECEGYYLSDEYTLKGKPLPKKYRGFWCDNCVPCVDFESP